MLQIAKAKAAVRFIHSDAVQAKFSHGWPQLFARKPVIRVNFGRERCDFVRCEPLGRGADHVGVFAKSEV